MRWQSIKSRLPRCDGSFELFDKIGQVYVVADIAYLLMNVLSCGVPFVFVVNLAMLITGPIVARYARDDLWSRWAIATALAGTAWAGWLIIFLFLLPVLII